MPELNVFRNRGQGRRRAPVFDDPVASNADLERDVGVAFGTPARFGGAVKVVVVGGSGRIGAKLVNALRGHGHEAVSADLTSGVNTLTGEGLIPVLREAAAVVDVSNAPSFGDSEALEFFKTSTEQLVDAERATSVRHHIMLSIVGVEHLSEQGYFRGKLVQEQLIRASGIPYSIFRSTQFFEFIGNIADAATIGNEVRLPRVLIQPIAADAVVNALAMLALGAPVNGTIEIAGPEQFRLDDLVRRELLQRQDGRAVIVDEGARYFGARLTERSLVPENGALAHGMSVPANAMAARFERHQGMELSCL